MNKLQLKIKSGVLWKQTMATPAGVFTAWWSNEGLYALFLPPQPPASRLLLLKTEGEQKEAGDGAGSGMFMQGGKGVAVGEKREEIEVREQLLAGLLLAYLRGEKIDFSVLPLDISDYTPFQVQVLDSLSRLAPYGCLISYRQLAAEVGSPQAARAVGRVLASNRTPIVVPCHRVRCSDGRWGGFSCGKEWKMFLWWLEGIGS